MPRPSTRFVQTTDSNIFVSNSRVQEEEIQLFNLPGPVYESKSGNWNPVKRNVLLTSWYATATVAGESDLWIALLIGDRFLNQDGEARGLTILKAGETAVAGPILTGNAIYNYPYVPTDQWIAIQYANASGHEDVTVQLLGRYV